MADDAVARINALSDLMRRNHHEVKAGQLDAHEGLVEMIDWIRQMAEAMRDFRREFVAESQAQREALWRMMDRLD